ncbi:MAG TPA: hypothetical protein VEX60_11445 [Pyrinomonadaceae bacterium]|nr:hypothetical protein [Pyrinomonadaceae bacterium]
MSPVSRGRFSRRAGDRDHLPAWTVHEARVEGAESARYLIGAKY